MLKECPANCVKQIHSSAVTVVVSVMRKHLKMLDCIFCNSFNLKDLCHANIKRNTKGFKPELSPVMKYSIIPE